MQHTEQQHVLCLRLSVAQWDHIVRCAWPQAPSRRLPHTVDIKFWAVGVKAAEQRKRRPFFKVNQLVSPISSVLSTAATTVAIAANIHHTDCHRAAWRAFDHNLKARVQQ
jgi:hypothetical protein